MSLGNPFKSSFLCHWNGRRSGMECSGMECSGMVAVLPSCRLKGSSWNGGLLDCSPTEYGGLVPFWNGAVLECSPTEYGGLVPFWNGVILECSPTEYGDLLSFWNRSFWNGMKYSMVHFGMVPSGIIPSGILWTIPFGCWNVKGVRQGCSWPLHVGMVAGWNHSLGIPWNHSLGIPWNGDGLDTLWEDRLFSGMVPAWIPCGRTNHFLLW